MDPCCSLIFGRHTDTGRPRRLEYGIWNPPLFDTEIHPCQPAFRQWTGFCQAFDGSMLCTDRFPLFYILGSRAHWFAISEPFTEWEKSCYSFLIYDPSFLVRYRPISVAYTAAIWWNWCIILVDKLRQDACPNRINTDPVHITANNSTPVQPTGAKMATKTTAVTRPSLCICHYTS